MRLVPCALPALLLLCSGCLPPIEPCPLNDNEGTILGALDMGDPYTCQMGCFADEDQDRWGGS
jgi:hypothetical protein